VGQGCGFTMCFSWLLLLVVMVVCWCWHREMRNEADKRICFLKLFFLVFFFGWPWWRGVMEKAKKRGAKIDNFCNDRRNFSTCLGILQSKLLNEMTGTRICPSYTPLFFSNPTDRLSLLACLLLFLELIKQLTWQESEIS